MALDLTGIGNVNEFYSHHYLAALLEGDLKGLLSRWEQAEKEENRTPPHKALSRSSEEYFKAKARAAATATVEDRFSETHPINVRLDDKMREELRKIAKAENRTLSNLIATVLREFLAKRKRGS